MNTETLEGTATRHIATSCGRGIEAGQPVRVYETPYLPGQYTIRAAGGRRNSHLTWAQVIDRVEVA